MRTLRIAHLSDTHLGYRSLAKHDPVSGRNQRSIDIERAFAWAIDDILARDIDLVIHSGDLFHHSRPVFPAIGAAIRQLRKLERKDIPVVLIAGNHDTPRLRMTGSVYSLLESALPDVRFFGGYDDHQFALEQLDVVLTVTPHGRLTNPEPASVFPVRDRRNVLVTHGLVPHMDLPYSLREPGEEEISEFMLDQAFDYIALGHYHQHGQPRPNAWYAGSTERIGWGDVETEPGYLIVELGSVGSAPAVERVQVPIARPMHAHTVPERIVASQDGVRIAEHVLDWLQKLDSPEAMTRILMPDAPRPVRRHAEVLVKEDADGYVWSVQIAGRSLESSAIAEHHPDLPSLSLLEQFAAFVTAEQDAGTYDPIFAVNFAIAGRQELETAMATIESQLTSEES